MRSEKGEQAEGSTEQGAGAPRGVPAVPPSCRLAVLLLALVTTPALAQSRLTQDEALRLAFPGAEVERRTAFLTAAQLEAVQARAGRGTAPPPSVVSYYVATTDGAPAGTAYFDAHRVRTLSEVLMIVIAPGGEVRRVEVLRFDEPPDYRPPAGWLALLAGRPLAGLSLRGGVPPLAGATLTAEAVTSATRRALALHAVLAGEAGR